jgi:hypothetical protein
MPAPNPLPRADLSEYLFHGGPKAEDLFGGVLNGEFVRGGRLWNVLKSKEELANLTGRTLSNMAESMSVLQSGTDVSQSQDLLSEYRKRVNILKSSGSKAEDVVAARSWIERNKDIVSRTLSGQVHMTGIQPTISAGNSAYEYGGIHLIKVPKNLNPAQRLAETGQSSAANFREIPFWGQHQPIASTVADYSTRTRCVNRSNKNGKIWSIS